MTVLLIKIADSSGKEPENLDDLDVSTYASSIPIDLRSSKPPPPGTLWLTGPAADALFQLRDELAQESDDGVFEHLKWKDLWRSAWRLVCEVWLSRGNLNKDAAHRKSSEFVSAHARPQQDWRVEWEIDNLSVEEQFTVASVAFLRFDSPENESRQETENSFLSKIDEKMIGRAFARVFVRASTREKAVERARHTIDDALHVLRTVLVTETYLSHQHFQQKLGANIRAEQISGSPFGYQGAQWEHHPYQFAVSGDLLTVVRGRAQIYDVAFDSTLPSDIAETIRRGFTWIGSSVIREEPADKVLDLWRALESLLCGPHETSNKAAIVGLRYILLLIASGETHYVRGPIELIRLYRLRNEIAHGAASRLTSKEEARTLLMVAKDALKQEFIVLQSEPEIRSLDQFFAHIQTRTALEQTLQLVESKPVPQWAQGAPNKAREWLKALEESDGTD